MQFKVSPAVLLAFAASALAQNPKFDPIYTPTSNEKVNAGSSINIEWEAPDSFKDVTVSISLIGGATQNTQVPIMDIASGIPNSAKKYSWTIPSSLGKDAVYGLVIKSEANPTVDFQYSNPFHIVVGEGSIPSPSSSSPSSPPFSPPSSPLPPYSNPSPTAPANSSVTPRPYNTPPSPTGINIVSPNISFSATPAITPSLLPVAAIPSQSPDASNSPNYPAANRTASRTTTIATLNGTAAAAQATAGAFAVLGGLAVAALF